MTMSDRPEVSIGKLTRREFRERMASGALKACIIPVAAVEQHLEHLAMEHDWRSAQLVSRLVAERLQPSVLVAEGMMAGISEHHMRHFGTLTLKPGSFLAVLFDLIESMVRAGFKNILVLNGHGGNIAPCQGIWGQFQQLADVNLQFLPYWDVLDLDRARKALRTGVIPGHAQEFETAFALANFPENVRTDMWTDQEDQAPAMATAAAGAELTEMVVAGVAQYLSEMIDGRRMAEIPPYFP